MLLGEDTVHEGQQKDAHRAELLDFARLQLDTVRYGRLGGEKVRVPVWDESVTPMTVKEIRKRYGL